jgi:hypothetical protein
MVFEAGIVLVGTELQRRLDSEKLRERDSRRAGVGERVEPTYMENWDWNG